MSKNFDDLLYNLRVLGMIEDGEYISCDSKNNIESRWSSSWWNTLTSSLKFETFEQTYDCLKNVYCISMPDYLIDITEFDEKGNLLHACELKLSDLLKVLELSRNGVVKLKNIYQKSYPTTSSSRPTDDKSEGKYDDKFNTIIESYIDIDIKLLKVMLKKKCNLQEKQSIKL